MIGAQDAKFLKDFGTIYDENEVAVDVRQVDPVRQEIVEAESVLEVVGVVLVPVQPCCWKN